MLVNHLRLLASTVEIDKAGDPDSDKRNRNGEDDNRKDNRGHDERQYESPDDAGDSPHMNAHTRAGSTQTKLQRRLLRDLRAPRLAASIRGYQLRHDAEVRLRDREAIKNGRPNRRPSRARGEPSSRAIAR